MRDAPKPQRNLRLPARYWADLDRHRDVDSRTKEGFANAFARQYGKRL